MNQQHNSNPEADKDSKVSIITAVRTPLGFFVLVVLVVEVILGITANLSIGSDRSYLIIGMLTLIFMLVLIVAGMAIYRPSALYGKPAPDLKKNGIPHLVSIDGRDKTKNLNELKKFFGNDILTEQFKIVHGTFTKIPYDLRDEIKPIYQKIFRDRSKFMMLPPDTITTLNTVHALSYFLQEFSKYRQQPFTICADHDALSMYHNNSFLSISGPLSNELTDIALKEPSNKFLRFIIIQEPKGAYGIIESVPDGKKFQKGPEDIGTDYGIIVKIKNCHNPEKQIFVCAGLEKQGTSAAVWYLTNHWNELYQKYGTKEFGVVIKVVRDQDNLSTVIHSVTT